MYTIRRIDKTTSTAAIPNTQEERGNSISSSSSGTHFDFRASNNEPIHLRAARAFFRSGQRQQQPQQSQPLRQQQVTGHNNVLNALIRTVMDDKPDFAVYDFKNGERLKTGFPISLKGKPTYFVFVITPTSAIYSQINKVISNERLEMFSLIAGTTAAIVILVIFLIRWSGLLDNEVKRRTTELDKANNSLTEYNKQLALANKQLKVHDKMQKDFINIAAHELRIPIQPILGLTQIIRDKISIKKEERE
jgi:hypothetical protein